MADASDEHRRVEARLPRETAAEALQIAAVPSGKAGSFQRALLRWLSHSWPTSLVSRAGVSFMRALPLLCFFVVARRSWRLLRLFRSLEKPFLLFVGRTALEFWAFIELGFWFYFRWKKASLEARRAYQPSVLHKEPGERSALLRRVLASTDRIHSAGAAFSASTPRPGSSAEMPAIVVDGEQPMVRRGFSGSGSIPPSERRSHLLAKPSVENFLRYYDQNEDGDLPSESDGFWYAPDAHRAALPAGDGAASPCRRPGRLQSLENLLRQRDIDCHLEDAKASPKLEKRPADGVVSAAEELRCFKHLELCSWYRRVLPGNASEICGDVTEIWRGNIEEWILSYWFDGAESVDVLLNSEKIELDELVEEVVQWAGLGDRLSRLGAGADGRPARERNPLLKCFRFRNDPFPAVHRPLLAYAMTAFVGPALGSRTLAALGFRPYRSGSTEYWFKPPRRDGVWQCRKDDVRPHSLACHDLRPLVFCHGIGVGPTMCLSFLQRLTQGPCGDHPIFLVDTAAISMRFSDNVPGAREVAANMVDMLEVWGFSQAHFVGHSFGSFLLSWMLRYQKSYVIRCTFLDPVCFLVLKVLAEGHELQQVRSDLTMDLMELGIKYFVMTELFVCNFVCRCFFWEESMLDLQDLEGIEALIVLESEDNIVPTHSVHRLVLSERARRRSQRPSDSEGDFHDDEMILGIEWVEGQPHAGFLFDAQACQQVCTRLSDFHVDGRRR